MATSKIVLKKSSVVAKTPLVTDLDYGELALNYADGKLFYKTALNNIDYFSAGSNDTPVVISTTQPVGLSKYLWIQTGLGSSGTDFTFWFEDGVAA
jgi:hypothetical protein